VQSCGAGFWCRTSKSRSQPGKSPVRSEKNPMYCAVSRRGLLASGALSLVFSTTTVHAEGNTPMLPGACVRACVHVCMRVCVYACVRACMHACKQACMRACMRVCVHAWMHACVRGCVRVCVRVCVRMCVRVRVHAPACECECVHTLVCGHV